MSPRADEPSPGETRAERRRRRQAAQWGGLPEPSAAFDARPAGPYDPHPYGVRAYPDIEDAVLEEYVEDTVPPAQYQAQPYAGATRPPEPPRADDGRWRADPPAAYGDGGYGDGDYGDELTPAAPAVEAPTAPVEPDPAPAAWGDPALGAEPIRHVAHRAYGGAAPRPEIASTPHTPSADLTQPEVGTPEYGTTQAGPTGSSTTPSGLTQSGTADQLGRPTAAAPVESAAAPLDPAEAASAAAPSPGPLAASPLVGDDAGLDPAKEAARLQLLAAQAAAERLTAGRRSAMPSNAETPAERAARSDAQRRAAERIAADKVAAARLAAVKAAAAQRESGAVRDARRTTRAALPPAAPGRPAPTSAASIGTASASTAGASTAGASTAGGTGAGAAPGGPARVPPGRPDSPGGARPARARKVTPRWAKVAYSTAALGVLAGGLALTLPHVTTLLPPATPAAAPTSSPAATSAEATTAATGTASTAAAPTAVSSAMACDPAQWASELTGEAPETFTASGVAQAYCLTAGTVRDIGFAGLAVKKPAYTAADFAFVGPYLSPALKTQWDKDVADFVKSQDLTSASARRLSALSTLAWNRDGLAFDSSAAPASDFAVGKPVTWITKGPDGVTRLGLGFETGIVTHMVDGSGKKVDRILKRTYRIELVKGTAERPWLIDGYQITQAMAGLNTTTLPPSAPGAPSAPSAPATPTARASTR